MKNQVNECRIQQIGAGVTGMEVGGAKQIGKKCDLCFFC